MRRVLLPSAESAGKYFMIEDAAGQTSAGKFSEWETRLESNLSTSRRIYHYDVGSLALKLKLIMNNHFPRTITIFATVIALFGYNCKSHRMDILKFNPQIGGRYSYTIAEKDIFTNHIGNKNLEFKGNSNATLTLHVDQKMKTGYSINATINSFSIDALEDLPFDSIATDNIENGKVFKNENGFIPDLENDTFRMEANILGEILTMKGYEKARENIVASYTNYLGSKTQASEKLGSTYSENYFRGLFGSCFYHLPGKGIVLGGKWRQEFKFELEAPVILSIEYKFEHSHEGIANIEGQGDGTIDSGYFKNSHFRITHNLKLDISTGMIKTSEIEILIWGLLPNISKTRFEVHRTKTVQALKSF